MNENMEEGDIIVGNSSWLAIVSPKCKGNLLKIDVDDALKLGVDCKPCGLTWEKHTRLMDAYRERYFNDVIKKNQKIEKFDKALCGFKTWLKVQKRHDDYVDIDKVLEELQDRLKEQGITEETKRQEDKG
jgi:hypothetical protein